MNNYKCFRHTRTPTHWKMMNDTTYPTVYVLVRSHIQCECTRSAAETRPARILRWSSFDVPEVESGRMKWFFISLSVLLVKSLINFFPLLGRLQRFVDAKQCLIIAKFILCQSFVEIIQKMRLFAFLSLSLSFVFCGGLLLTNQIFFVLNFWMQIKLGFLSSCRRFPVRPYRPSTLIPPPPTQPFTQICLCLYYSVCSFRVCR